MVKSVIEFEKYRYSVVILSVSSFPIDDLLLGNIMRKRGYAIQENTEENTVATKQNSQITINSSSSKIQIDSANSYEILSISNELLKIILTECNFNSDGYQFIYQIEGEMILSNLGDPVKNMSKMISKQMNQNINHIFDSSLQTDGLRFYNGDKYGLNYTNIEFAPRMGQENHAYYLKFLVRNKNKEIVDKFIPISEAKIIAFLNSLN